MTNPVAEIITKLDSLGRRNNGWVNAGPGRKPNPNRDRHGRYKAVTARIEAVDMVQLRANAKKKGISLGELVRTYIEWGLENEE